MLYKIFFIILFLLLSYTSYSQFTGNGDDQRYQAGIYLHYLDTLPPLREDMNHWTKFSYNYIDSLSTVIYNNNYIRENYKSLNIDSIKFFTSLYYFINSYNNVLLDSYTITTNWMTSNSIKYKTYPITWLSSYKYVLLYCRLNEIGKSYAFVTYMPYIYHIKIDSVIIGNDTTFYCMGDSTEYKNVSISATILDVIKGNKCCNCKIHNNGNILTFINDTSKKSCFNFGYNKDRLTNTGFTDIINSNSSIKTVNKGEEYIVFLKPLMLNDSLDNITIDTRYEATGGLFEVTNGYVNDMSNLFYQGDGTFCPLDSFIAIIKEKMKTVESWINIPSTGVKDYSVNNLNITLSPNPVSEILSINNFTNEYNSKIAIYNIYGQKVMECPYSDKIDVSGLMRGVYYFRLSNKTIKFIKQ